jgi:hypothetical protein
MVRIFDYLHTSFSPGKNIAVLWGKNGGLKMPVVQFSTFNTTEDFICILPFYLIISKA